MKTTLRVIVVASLAVFVIAMLRNPRQMSATLPTANLPAPHLLADGGLPMPPWPQTGNVLVADGGLPMPPWPSSGSVLAGADAFVPPPAKWQTIRLPNLIS